MRRIAIVLAFIAANAAFALPAAAADVRDTCALIVRKTGGGADEERAMPNLSVIAMEESAQGIHADPVPGYDIAGFACDRDDIVPLPDDVKVLVAGYKLVLRNAGTKASSEWTLTATGVHMVANLAVDDASPGLQQRLTQRNAEFATRFPQPVPIAPPPPGPAPTHDTCGAVIVPEAGGREEERAVPNFSVIETTKPNEGEFSIPAIAGYKLVGFVCDRDDIVPFFNDIKVLMAGYRLYIRVAAKHQKAVLYMYGPRLRFAPIEGELSADESARVGPRMGEYMQYDIPPGGTWTHEQLLGQ